MYYFVFHTVSLSADALSIPGGYVVPKGGTITFICNSSFNRVLLWRVNLTEMNNIENLVTTFTLKGTTEFNSSDTANANPTSFNFHNIFIENSPYVVEYTDPSIGSNGVSRAMIYNYNCCRHETLCMVLFLYTCITGSPTCLTVNTTVTTSLTVSVQNSQMT